MKYLQDSGYKGRKLLVKEEKRQIIVRKLRSIYRRERKGSRNGPGLVWSAG